jgi:hypothetical protein
LQGFDEFMNVVMDEAAEVYVKEAKPRRELGALLPIDQLNAAKLDMHRPYPPQGRQHHAHPTGCMMRASAPCLLLCHVVPDDVEYQLRAIEMTKFESERESIRRSDMYQADSLLCFSASHRVRTSAAPSARE